MRRNLYEFPFGEEITKTPKNLADKVKGVFKNAARNAPVYGMATLLFYGTSSLALPNSSEAQTACATYDSITDGLKKRYGEEIDSMGLSSSGGVIVVYSNDKEGTWTLLLTLPDGTSCLIAEGELWENNFPKKLIHDPET